MDSLGFSDPRRLPALPPRPSRLADEAMNRGATVFDSASSLVDAWNAWADCAEKVFQQMGNQLADLEVSDAEYISFVSMFASHPARPTRQSLKKITEHEDHVMRTMPHKYLAHLHSLWTAYADSLEKTYVSTTAQLGRCNLLASPFETTSTRGQLHGILRSMLGPERPFQGLVDTQVHEASVQGPSAAHMDQMVSEIERLNLCDAPAMHIEVVDGLVVLLKNVSLGAGFS